jgi:uncharacterized membrane protein
METVITVMFAKALTASEGLAALRELDAQGQVDLISAAILVRSDDGRVALAQGPEGAKHRVTVGTIDLLVEVLNGPLGRLLTAAAVPVLGSLLDAPALSPDSSTLSAISRTIAAGQPTLVGEIIEPGMEPVDRAMARLNGTVTRHRIDDAKAEIAAADEAQHAAIQEARRRLVELRTWLQGVERGTPQGP